MDITDFEWRLFHLRIAVHDLTIFEPLHALLDKKDKLNSLLINQR